MTLSGCVEEWHLPSVQLWSGFMNSRNMPRLPGVSYSVTQWSVVAISSALTRGFSGNVPLLHMSTQCPGTTLYVTSLGRTSHVLVWQATNAGMRRPSPMLVRQATNAGMRRTSPTLVQPATNTRVRRPSPVLVQQVTNARMRMPGYKGYSRSTYALGMRLLSC